MNRPDTLADVAHRRNAGEELSPLLREFLDTFYGRIGSSSAAATISDEPEPLRDPIEHAYLGAVAEHLGRRWGLDPPAWSNHASRFLKRPYFTSPIEGLKALLLVESPIAFRRRLIFTEAEPLRRARMPVSSRGIGANS